VKFRDASPTDPESVEILAEYFAMRAAEFPGDYRPAFPGPEAFRGPDAVFLLAVDGDDDGVIGCGAIRRLPDVEIGPRFEVKHLFVRPSARGIGAGRAILEELERRAIERSAADLVLDTHHTLEAAGALYARSGFVSIEPYNDNPNATRWYRKVL
jgi:GNAT superfamily N-acetyltransferase